MKAYQTNYATTRPQMYDQTSRVQKAERMIKTLEGYFGNNISKLTLLDIGSSTGIITNYLAKYFKEAVGIDIDQGAVEYAKKTFKRQNLTFKLGDSMKLNFPSNSFDVVICAQVYDHVPNPKKLFSEVYRILKTGGACYLAASNKYWPVEPHYNLPLLSWLPKSFANFYIRLAGKANTYYETPLSYWELKKLTHKFNRKEYTQEILIHPYRFGYEDVIPERSLLHYISIILSPIAKYFAPNFFWLLIKKN